MVVENRICHKRYLRFFEVRDAKNESWGRNILKKVKYKKFGRNYLIKNIYVIVPLITLFFLVIYFRGKNNLLFYVSLSLLIGGGIAGTIWDIIRLKKFVCPRCGASISGPTIKHRKEGDPINYYCPVCDIEWETGLYESTSS